MKLQILISQYDETDEIVKPLLDSIALQQNVDFSGIGVIICNDGSDVLLSNNLLDGYPFGIQYYQLEHNGVSATRQACFDKATADYVMFCDADDMFYNMCGLWMIFREMQGDGFDTFTSVFVEESRIPDTGEVTYLNREQDSTFVHGKVHRRQYLIDKNIRWNPALTIHEDSYFNCLAQNCLDSPERGKYCQTPFYLWRWRDSSVCRRDPKYILKTYNNMLDSNTALINQFLQRDKKETAQFYCASMIFDAYYTMNKEEWINQENQEYRKATEDRFTKYYHDFETLFNEMDMQQRNMISASVRNRMVMEGMPMETVTFNDWIKER